MRERSQRVGSVKLEEEDVRSLIAAGEGSRVEFKRGLPRPAKVARTLAAFANTRGGSYLVGVDDRRKVLGAPRVAQTVEDLKAIADDFVRPPLEPLLSVVRIDSKPVVVAVVGLSPARPHVVTRDDGSEETPVRIGSSTRSAQGAALTAIQGGAKAGGLAGLRPLERQILSWVAARGDAGTGAFGRCGPRAFAQDCNVGLVRARRAFDRLERAGRLLGFGSGAGRTYSLP